MKKIVSLILGMFLILLSGCGKSSKLIRPTDSAETQETTWSESKPQSEEEKKEEKKTDYMWYVRAAGYTAIAAGTIYLIYCVFDMCNKEPIPPHKNNDPIPEEFHNQPQQENQFVQNEVPQQNQQQAVDMLSDTNIDESIPQENTELQQEVVETSEDIPDSDNGPSETKRWVAVDDDQYSDTPLDEILAGDDGVDFDVFNWAQASGYPTNNLTDNHFEDKEPAIDHTWHLVGRSGKPVKTRKKVQYLEEIGWGDEQSLWGS